MNDLDEFLEDVNNEAEEEYEKVRPFIIHQGYGRSFDNLEEAKKVALKSLKRRPWGNEQYIWQLVWAGRGVPSEDVKIQEIDVKSAYEQKALENK